MVAVAHAATPDLDRAPGPTGSPPEWDIGHVHFSDVMSALNPLQYLPVVGMIYRETTGDSVHPALRIAVSAAASLLFGGPIGLAATMIGAAISEISDGDASAPHAARMAEATRAYGRLARAA